MAAVTNSGGGVSEDSSCRFDMRGKVDDLCETPCEEEFAACDYGLSVTQCHLNAIGLERTQEGPGSIVALKSKMILQTSEDDSTLTAMGEMSGFL